MNQNPSPTRSTVASDLLASAVVFLVALPLCMGIAIASGAPPTAGLITGIVGGLIVGPLAGCPLQVSGPAAGLAVIVWQLIDKFGFEALGPMILAAGLVQLGAGLLGIGPWFRAVPPGVVHGMLAGIGVLIFSSQFHVMLDDKPKGNGLTNLLTIPEAVARGIFDMDFSIHHQAALTGLLTILAIMLWSQFAPRKLRFVPAALVGVLVGSATALLGSFSIARVSVPESLFSSFQLPGLSAFNPLFSVEGLVTVLALAAIASAETLLTAVAVDGIQTRSPRTNFNQELMAQGLGNMVCGVAGGLPMTGVIVRSKANVDAGAETRLSTVLHGAWLLAFVAILPGFLTYIPVASLAALLVFIGFKLVDRKKIQEIAAIGPSELVIYFGTLIGIVVTDLLQGVLFGIFLAVAKLLFALSRFGIWLEEHPEEKSVILHMHGVASFMFLPRLAGALEMIRPGMVVHVRHSELRYLDVACEELIRAFSRQYEARGGQVVIDWDDLDELKHPSRKEIRAAAAKFPVRTEKAQPSDTEAEAKA